MKRILITGSREYRDLTEASAALARVLQYLDLAPHEAVLVHGAAQGADTVLATAASAMGMGTEAHPAQWSFHEGCSCKDHSKRCGFAGFRRNTYMLSLGADFCLGFPLHPEQLPLGTPTKNTSRGTWNMLRSAASAGVPTYFVRHENGRRALHQVIP